MKFHPMLEFYDQVMHTKTRIGLEDIELEIKKAVLGRILEDDRDIMTLNLAIQLRYTQFDLQDIKNQSPAPTVIVAGSPEDILSEILNDLFEDDELPPVIPEPFDDFDPEQAQLDKFHDDELDEIKNGNVIPMKGFGKKL